MKIFRKEEKFNGRVHLYVFGFKVFSYKKVVIATDFTQEQLVDIDIAKYRGLIRNKDSIHTIILGSSHARNGFLPIDGEFNLGLSSQDLYRSYHLYKWIVKHRFHLKNIVLFYSVFHPGLQLEKTKEAWKCIPYKYLYNIPYAYRLPKHLQNMKREMKIYCKSANINVSSAYKGEYSYEEITDFATLTAKELVEKHLKNNRRNNHQNKYLVKMIKLAHKSNHNMYIVTPPYRQDYLDCLPDYNEVNKELLNIINMFPDVKILNFQNDEDFEDDDFKDSDHLNKKGGIKLSAKIRERMS